MKHKIPQKPEIAEINKLNAEKNILRKLNILEAWAKSGIPFVQPNKAGIGKELSVLEYFPKSVRQFNFWDGSQNSQFLKESLPSILRNANETLNSHKGLRLRVNAILETLVIKSISQSNQEKPLKIKKLVTSLELEKKLRIVAETELVVLREHLKLLQRKLSESRNASDGVEREFQRLVKSLERDLEEANKEIAALKVHLAKVVPLKKV